MKDSNNPCWKITELELTDCFCLFVCLFVCLFGGREGDFYNMEEWYIVQPLDAIFLLFNPTDGPFETVQIFHIQKCPLVTHGDTIWTVLVASYTTIQMVLEGPLIHHLEVSKQGFGLADTTIWKDPNKVLY